ncbi:YheU family protein [Thalassotalea ganghwensis]
MIIPYQSLASTTLENIIESYILREGTDYGELECSLDDKKAQLRHQIKQGEIVIVYSELHETINLLPKQQFNQSGSQHVD